MSGSNETNRNGSYGQLGIRDPSNIPPPRRDALSWTDLNGNLWLFGGGNIKDNSNINFV
jgi:hypothetical protein